MTEITLTGFVHPIVSFGADIYGYDLGGNFGPAGASLAGDAFTATFVGDYANPHNITDVTLTINGYTHDFGGGTGDFINNSTFWQYQLNGGDYIYFGSGTGAIPNANGSFYINNDGWHYTDAYMLALSVPAPIVGTGPLALAFLAALLIRFASSSRRTRRGRSWLLRLSLLFRLRQEQKSLFPRRCPTHW